jgi:hypothetical protein
MRGFFQMAGGKRAAGAMGGQHDAQAQIATKGLEKVQRD